MLTGSAEATASRISYPSASPAAWPLSVPSELGKGAIAQLRQRVDTSGDQAQYGWGHTIDFGPFTKEGILGRAYLDMVGAIDGLGWWPAGLAGRTVADIGAYSGGVSALLAARGANPVYAVDEIPEHVAQSRVVAEAFGLDAIHPVEASLFDLDRHVPASSLDYAFLGGVLYHLSDMLAGLVRILPLLKPGGWLILDTNAVECLEHSYANFGRFYAGMWWQPTGRCVLDLLQFSGYDDPQVVFYRPARALARGRRGANAVPPFRRGLSVPFPNLRDAVSRPMDAGVMAPAPDTHAQAGMLRRAAGRAATRTLNLPLSLWRRLRRTRG